MLPWNLLGSSGFLSISCPRLLIWASLVAQRLKHLPAMWETWEEELRKHPNILIQVGKCSWTHKLHPAILLLKIQTPHLSQLAMIHPPSFPLSVFTLHTKPQRPWSEVKVAQLCLDSSGPQGLYSPWNSPGQNTEVSSLSLQGISPTQGSNSGLLHCRWILYQLSYKGSPRLPKKNPQNPSFCQIEIRTI